MPTASSATWLISSTVAFCVQQPHKPATIESERDPCNLLPVGRFARVVRQQLRAAHREQTLRRPWPITSRRASIRRTSDGPRRPSVQAQPSDPAAPSPSPFFFSLRAKHRRRTQSPLGRPGSTARRTSSPRRPRGPSHHMVVPKRPANQLLRRQFPPVPNVAAPALQDTAFQTQQTRQPESLRRPGGRLNLSSKWSSEPTAPFPHSSVASAPLCRPSRRSVIRRSLHP